MADGLNVFRTRLVKSYEVWKGKIVPKRADEQRPISSIHLHSLLRAETERFTCSS